MYSRSFTLVRLLVVATALTAVAGCGGSSADEVEMATKLVRGPGFVFRAPADRGIERTDRAVVVLPAGAGASELESVTRFPLVKPFRRSLWPGVVTELDGVAGKLAAGVGGEVESSEDVQVSGLQARRYEIAYESDGKELRQRITFVFRRREEFQLYCRFADGPPPEACSLLESSFRAV